jgi:hypothetical protein
MAHPLGRKLESHTKTLMEGGFPRNQSHPLHIREPMEQREESRARYSFPESRQRSTIGQGLGLGGCLLVRSLRQRMNNILL